MPEFKIGKVHVLQPLGTGANSSVFKVRREADAKEYALKIIPIEDEEDKKYLEQAKHEIRISNMLNHPNCIKLYAFETETDWLFRVKKAKLLIEYVDGKTLDQMQLLNMAKLLRVCALAADGLAHMHKQGVIHADLKPGNIMLGSRMKVKIIDYGLAWVKGEPKFRVQGTPGYIAPETVQHKMISERTDIFNFGATMYKLATLKLPPQVPVTEAGLELTEAQYNKQYVPPHEINKGVPIEFSNLITRCLSFNAMKRPERMTEVQGILDRLADEAAAGLEEDELE